MIRSAPTAAVTDKTSRAKNAESSLQAAEQLQEQQHLMEGGATTGFPSFKKGFDLAEIPAKPNLRSSRLSVQCCAKDGKPCGCAKCKAAEEENDNDEYENNTQRVTETAPATQPEPVQSMQPEQQQNADAEISSGGQAATEQGPTLIVDDEATELTEGQMTKTDFLRQLRSEICSAIGPVIARAGQTTDGCPYLNYWLDLYEQKSAQEVQQTVHRYAPESRRATRAADYISAVTQRAVRAAEVWASSGRLTGVPEGVPTTLPDQPSIQQNNTAQQSPPPENSSPPVMPKAKEGGTRNINDPAAIQNELGNGDTLDAGVRSRMESAFGANFSHVRTHTDSNAAAVSRRVNARAFTVGEHVAFGAGEYAPGTMMGDALIAHELAHVVQQKDAKPEVGKMEAGSEGYEALEKDADHAATGVVTSLWGGMQGFAQQVMPKLRSGLRLQGCPNNTAQQQQQQQQPPQQQAQTPTVVVGNFRNSGSTADSGENNCVNCPRDLGVHANDFKNGMELRGDITNHTAQAQYDFKRTREGGIWRKANGTWTQTFHDGPGADDDSTNNDEMLTPVNNHIYSEDIPGLGSNPGGGNAAVTEAVLKGNFVEFVNVKVGTGSWSKQSNDFNWHSVSWVEKVNGVWQRKAGMNEIDTGHTTVGTGNP